MGKIKEMIMNWGEMYDSGIPMEFTRDQKNWFDAVDAPQFNDGRYYREKIMEHQSEDNILPKDFIK